MKYQSTRSEDYLYTSAQAIKTGLAPDGGLFVPEKFVRLGADEIKQLSEMSYNKKAFNILRNFLTDFSDDEIKNCVNLAYNKQNFETESIAPYISLTARFIFRALARLQPCV